jgi:hypothetical protein
VCRNHVVSARPISQNVPCEMWCLAITPGGLFWHTPGTCHIPAEELNRTVSRMLQSARCSSIPERPRTV